MEELKFVNVEFTLSESTVSKIEEASKNIGVPKGEFIERIFFGYMPLEAERTLQLILENMEMHTYLLKKEELCDVYKKVMICIDGKLRELYQEETE